MKFFELHIGLHFHKAILGLMLLALVGSTATAQQVPAISQVNLNPYFVNPSYAGFTGYSEIHCLYKKLWSNIPGSPEDQIITASTKIFKYNLGVGVKLHNEVNNFLGNTGAQIAFAYHLNLAEQHKLSFGIAPGVTFHRIYFDRLRAEDPFESTILNRTEGASAFDVDFGITYSIKDLRLSLASLRMLQSNMVFQTEEQNNFITLSHVRHYNVNASYEINSFSPKWAVIPSASIYSVQGMSSVIEGSIKAKYNDLIWVGANYRNQAAVGGILGLEIDEQFVFSYNYEYPLNEFSQISNNSHEIVLGFKFGNKRLEEQNQEIKKEIERLSKENEEQYELLKKAPEEESPDYDEIVKSEIEKIKEEQKEYMDGLMSELRLAIKDSAEVDRKLSENLEKQNAASKEKVIQLEQMALRADSLPQSYELLEDINELKKQNQEQFAMIKNLIAVNDSLQRDMRLYNEVMKDLDAVIRDVQLSLTDSISPANFNEDYYEVIGAFHSFKYAKMFQRGVKRDYGLNSAIMSQVQNHKEYYVVYSARTDTLNEHAGEIKEYKRRILMFEIHGFEENEADR